MASQSFNVIGQEEEQELVAFETRQSRGPTPQSRPNSRMEEMLSHLVRIQEEATKSQDATAKSLESRMVENTRSQAEANKSSEAKVSELAKSQSKLHTSTNDKLSQIAYKQIEQIAELSDLVDRISTVERSLQSNPLTGSDPTRRSPTPSGHALLASAPYPLALTTPSSLALERSKTAKSSNLPLPTLAPLRRSLRLEMKRNPSLYSRFLNSPVEEEEEEEEVGFRPQR